MQSTLTAPRAAPPPAARSVSRRRLLVSSLGAYLFLLPTFALIGVFSYYPAVSALYHAFTDWNGVMMADWIGIQNFREMMRDPVLLASLGNMVKVVVWVLLINMTIPLLVAELI